ncbi:hypothetical protein BJ138DRAFT_987642, partial [Hygrophoropsis aurantiaca]
SRSPQRGSSNQSKRRPTSPSRYRQQQAAPKANHSFPSGAGQPGLTACAVCLGRFRHNVHKCTSSLLWDNTTKSYCHRNPEGRLVNPKGLQLCYDWQRPNGCPIHSRDHIHECS